MYTDPILDAPAAGGHLLTVPGETGTLAPAADGI
jgi:hypothetical protein